MAEIEIQVGSSEKKIDFVQAFLMLFIAAIADLINIVLIFFALDDFGLIELVTVPLFGLWFYFNGGDWNYALRASLIELVPYLGVLPLYTIFIERAIHRTNHPKEKGSAAASKKKSLVMKGLKVAVSRGRSLIKGG